MQKDSPKPPRHPRVSPDQTLLYAGVVILVVIIVHEIITKDLRVANFAEPITVDAIVIDPHIRRQGGGQICQPVFRYELDDKMWVAQLPSSNPRSCYRKDSIVSLSIDIANPERVSDTASERYAQQSWYSTLVMATVMLVSGGLLWWRKSQRGK